MKKTSLGIRTTGLLALSSVLLAIPANAQDEAKGPEKEVYEAIGMLIAQGSGLNQMEFSPAEIDLIVSGIQKGLKLKTLPPELRTLEPKIQAIMQAKMEKVRQAQTWSRSPA